MNANTASAPAAPAVYEYEPSRLSPERVITVHGATPRVRFRLEKPCIAVIDDLLTPEECKTLIELATPGLQPSMVRRGAVDIVVDTYERSSYTHQFRRNEEGLIAQLDQRFAELMGLSDQRGEGLAVSRYEPGQLIRPHCDYFRPPHPVVEGGARLATLLVYLNDDFEAGETVFGKVGLTVEPKQGSAVYFEYGNSKGQRDLKTLHEGRPPTTGTKWIANKFVRAYCFPA